MKIDPDLQAWRSDPGPKAIWDAIGAAGGEARIVGGAIRDALSGRKTEDIDFAVNLQPDQVVEALEKAGIKAVPTGISHGTITAVVEKKGYEITSLRRDIATDGRHAQVAFTDDWAADAARRDFTFNALYADSSGRIYDFVGGLDDLAARRVRFIGEPRARIREDFLRILRFFRFLAQMAGPGEPPLPPDPESLTACKDLAPELRSLSAERIAKEWLRLLASDEPAPVVELMAREGVLSHILPEPIDVKRLARLTREEKTHGLPLDPLRRFAALLETGHDHVARRFKLSRAQVERMTLWPEILQRFADVHDRGTLRQFLYDYDVQAGLDGAAFAVAQGTPDAASFLPEIQKWEKPVFPLQGKDLLELGLSAGPTVGEVLSQIEKWWRAQDFRPGPAACLAQARERINAR